MFQPFVNGAEVAIRAIQAGVPIQNDLHFLHAPGAPTEADLQALTDGIGSWVENELVTQLPDGVQMVEVYAYDASVNDGPSATTTFGATVTGTLPGKMAPNQNTIAASFKCARRGKRFRNRNYVLGLRDEDIVANQVVELRRTGLVNVYQALIGVGAVAPNWSWVCLSRTKDKVRLSEAETSIVTDMYFVNPYIDSQRGRNPQNG